MAGLTFKEIAELVNRSEMTKISAKPDAAGDAWALHVGEYRPHGRRFPFSVLYLQSRATLGSIAEARSEVSTTNGTDLHVVYPETRSRSIDSISDAFKGVARIVTHARGYLESFISNELSSYMERIKARDPKNYITPKIVTPSHIKLQRPNPIESFLVDPGVETSESPGLLATVLAEPGQGKTFMCEHLANQLATKHSGVIPILVKSDQWEDIKQEELSSLWKTMSHVFRHEDTPIPWISDCEEQFFKTTLKAGLFRIIFDGFDEYILRNRGEISGEDVLHQLQSLVEETGTRIVVTSRTSFWETEIENSASNHEQLNVYKIDPFDHNHARNYFKDCIVDSQSLARASQVFAMLHQESKDLAGRGLVLKLISDLFADSEEWIPKDQTSKAQVLPWLMHALCERETLRQRLPIEAGEQLEALRCFVSDLVQGFEPSQDLLEHHIHTANPTLTPEAIRQCCHGMRSHPLIREHQPGSWEITQEQILVSLLADQIFRLAKEKKRTELGGLDRDGNLEESLLRDVAYILLDTIASQEVSVDRKIEEIQSFVSTVQAVLEGNPRASSVFGQLLTFLLIRAVEKLESSGTRAEKTALLLNLLSMPDHMVGLVFSGVIKGFDFSKTTFDRCRFNQVQFISCEFDELSRFEGCHFIGLDSIGSPSLGKAEFKDCTAERGAREVMHHLSVRAGKSRYTADSLRSDIKSLVSRFVSKGGSTLKSVEDTHLGKGAIGVSQHREEIIKAMKRRILEQHRLSSGGSSKGWNIRESAKDSVLFFAANNLLTGELDKLYQELAKKIKLR